MIKFYGPIPPMITPFDQNGNVDLVSHIANVNHWTRAGLGGLLVLGSNSETVYLEEHEKMALIETTVDHAGNLPVLVGTGMDSIRSTVHLTNRAAEVGAKAALILTPYYYKSKMDDRSLIQYFTEVADQVDVPVLIYNVTKFTGINTSVEVVKILSQHHNIIGMKDSSGSIGQLVLFQEAASADFQILTGTASIWLPALQLGIDSAIMALANCAPSECVDIQQKFKAGLTEEAIEIYRRMVVLNQAVTATYGISGLKYACTKRGLKGGSVRAPLRDLTEEEQKAMDLIIGRTIKS